MKDLQKQVFISKQFLCSVLLILKSTIMNNFVSYLFITSTTITEHSLWLDNLL